MRRHITKRNILLTDTTRRRLESQKELMDLAPKTRAKFLFDQRERIHDIIEYLTFASIHLPEKQQRECLNAHTLQPLFQAVFRFNPELKLAGDKPKELSEEETVEPEKRRDRILEICVEALVTIGEVENAQALAPDLTKMLMESGTLTGPILLQGILPIYLKSIALKEKTNE